MAWTARVCGLMILASSVAPAQQVLVSPVYQGQPLSTANANYKTFWVMGSGGGFGSVLTPAAPTGTYNGIPGTNDTFNLRRAADAGDGGPVFATQTLQYPASGVLTWNPEMNGHYGILKGSVRIDGNIPPAGSTVIRQELLNPYGLELDTPIDAAGNFRILLWATTYSFSIRYNNNRVRVVDLTVTAGQETDAGTILAPSVVQNGTLSVRPLYQGQLLGALNADFSLTATVNGSQLRPLDRANPTTSDLRFPSSYPFVIRSGSTTVHSSTVTFLPASNVDITPELGGAMGLVEGIVTVNGVPPTGSGYFITGGSLVNGAFRKLVLPGTYTDTVTGPAGALRTFTYTVAAGQTTNVGTIAATESIGTLVIEPVYFGQPLATLGAGFHLRATVNGGPAGGHLRPATPTWTGSFLAGTHTVAITTGPNNTPLLTAPVTVAGNTTTVYQPEMSSVTGLFRGGLRIEGVPPSTPYSLVTAGGIQFPVTLATGDFRGLLWAGTYPISVQGAAPFTTTGTVVNGVETDFGLLGLLSFNPAILAGGGTIGGQRTWNFKLTNTGPAAVSAQIINIDVVTLSGLPCVNPVRVTALPVTFGSILAGGNATQGIVHNFGGSPGGCRYNIRFTISDGGVRRQEVYRANIFQ